MKIKEIQTCIMPSLPRSIFRCSVYRYVILVKFCYSIVIPLFWWRIITYLLTYLATVFPLLNATAFI